MFCLINIQENVKSNKEILLFINGHRCLITKYLVIKIVKYHNGLRKEDNRNLLCSYVPQNKKILLIIFDDPTDDAK